MGAAFSLLYPSLSLIVVDRVPETRRGAALGTFTAFFDAGVGLGAPLAGVAAALTGYEGAFLLAAAIALVCATTIAVAIAGRRRGRWPRAAPRPASARRRAASGRRGRSGRARRRAPTRRCRSRSGCGRVTASTQTHSPSGMRSRWTVRSTLMKRNSPPVEDGADPVADVGDDQRPLQRRGLLAGDEREPASASRPSPAPARGSRRSAPATPSPCGSRRPARSRKNSGTEPCSGPGGGSPGRSAPRAGRARAVRIRQPRARISSCSPSRSEASTSWTRRPGRTTLASTSTGPIGTGRRISKVTRPTWKLVGVRRAASISRPISAEGGPACWAPGSQGPRVSSVATEAVAVALVEGTRARGAS